MAMNDKKSLKCSFELLNAYKDGELGAEESKHVARHIEICEKCQEEYNRIQNISSVVNEIINEEVSHNSMPFLESRVIARLKEEQAENKEGFLSRLRSIRIMIPALAMTCIAFFLIFRSWHKSISTPTPSAIVKSVSSISDEIVIFVSPENGQTIIWFNDT